jgi:hypothetical protein
MYIYPNNDARRPRSTVAPLRGAFNDDAANLERIEPEATPELLQALRAKLSGAEEVASWYHGRNKVAFDYWHARWTGQTVDGRKWEKGQDGQIYPWPGASDTRVRTTEMIINEQLTVCMFALMNMKVQAQSSRPLATMKESQQATQLLNWQIFTHMSEEVYRELPLLMNWRNGFGAGIMEVVWEQEQRLYIQPTNLINLQAFAQHHGVRGEQMLEQFISDLFDPEREDAAIELIRSTSPLLNTKAKARKVMKDLRNMRTTDIPVVEVLTNKPRWTALRPMLDLLFPAWADDLQRVPWTSRVEYVTETELTDRIKTADYDENFVDEAIEKQGRSSGTDWRQQYTSAAPASANPYGSGDDEERNIRLEHTYRKGLRDGVPALYCTVWHQDCEEVAKHAPAEYEHGQMPYHVFRREYHERPLLSSRGTAEIVYPWEQEIKKQSDMRADRTDLELKPPLMTTYEDLVKMKEQFMPATILPMRRQDDARWFPAPPYSPGSIEIENSIMARVDRFFPFFNAKDPQMAQLFSQQLADAVLMEMKPVIAQTWQLMQQYLPDEVVAQVLGTQKEQQEEMQAFDLIVGSGQDQPMPMGSNYQLRLQVMERKLQSAQQNPATARILQQNPEILQVLQNRQQFMQRQIQQTENAQIGRMQVSNTFDKQAATPAALGGG